MKRKPLDSGQKHLLRLLVKCRKDDGWAPVSSAVAPLVQAMPCELVEFETTADLDPGGGRARLTGEGENLMAAMAWLE